MTIQIIEPGELRTTADGSGIVGRVGVIYQLRTTGESYKWNPVTRVMESMGAVPGAGNGSVFLSLTSGAGSAAANQAAIQAVSDRIAAGDFIREVVFPSGDFHHRPVVWTAPPANETVSSITTPESHWPVFKSAGTTTLINTEHRSGADWLFQGIPGTQMQGLRLENLRWAGPGVQVRDVRALTASLSANATSCTLPAGTVVSVGDAICISSDAFQTYVSAPPHWATVTGVTGTNPVTVQFADQATANGFAATSGNIVIVFRNQCAVQVGGASATRQDIFFNTAFRDCFAVDYFSFARLNDCTFQEFHKTWLNFCMFGIELGYNIDVTDVNLHAHQCQLPDQSATFTSGSAIVSTDTSKLKVGMSLNNATSSNAATLPDEAVIRSIDSPTQVTMSHPSSASVTRPAVPTMGIACAVGRYVSPFYPLQPGSVGGNGARTNSDALKFAGLICNHIRAMLAIDGNSSGTIEVDGFYSELNQRVALVGQHSNQIVLNLTLQKGKLEGINALSGPAIQWGNSNGGFIEVFAINHPGSPRVPFLDFINFEGPTIAWQDFVWTPTSGSAITGQFYFGGITPSGLPRCRFNLLSPFDTGHRLERGGVSGGQTLELNQVDLLTLTLTGNTTINNPPWGGGASNSAAQGKRLRIAAQQNGTGGFTLTMGSLFVNAAGTGLGTSAAGTANQCMALEFVWQGTKWRLVGGSFAWAPV